MSAAVRDSRVGSLTGTLSRIKISARGQFVNCLYPRPRKFRDVASAFEILVESGWPKQRYSNECRSRYRKSSEARLETYAISVQPPGDDDRYSRRHSPQRDPPAQSRKCRQQKRRRVAINDHDVDEVDRHPELVELEAREQRQCDENFERNQRRHSWSALQSQPQAVEHDPDEQEDGHAHEADFGREHEDHRACVQQQRQAESGHPAAARPLHGDAVDEKT
jgi:hypothetical protein